MLRSEAWLFSSTNFSKGTLAREVSRTQKAGRFRRDQSFQMEPPNHRVRGTWRRRRTRNRSENEGTHLRRNSVQIVCRKKWVESRSGSRAEFVFSGSDCLHVLRKHWQMWTLPRQLPRLVAKDAKWQDMEQLQGPLRSGLQGDSKILKNFEDQRVCSARACWTSKRRNFHWYATRPHPGASECRDRQTMSAHYAYREIGRAVSVV